MLKAIILLCTLSFAIFAEDLSKINFMIEDGLNTNFNQIQKLSSSLTDDQKFKLFETQKRKIPLPFLINMLLIPGVGSAIQKDYIGASIGFLPYMTGWSLIIVRANLAKPERRDFGYVTSEYNKATDDYYASRRIYLATGISLMGASWVYSMIETIAYSNHYNHKLGQALNLVSHFNIKDNHIEYAWHF